MKRHMIFLVLILYLLASLAGCSFAEPETPRPYTVTLPESWTERAEVEYLDNGADVIIDGIPTLHLRLVENIPGAREKAEALVADGYQWDYDVNVANSKYFFFIKAEESFPSELSLNDEDEREPKWQALDALHDVMIYPIENDMFEIESFEAQYTDPYGRVTKTYVSSFGVPKQNTYTNYVSGISFVIPESIREKCLVRVERDLWITLFYNSGYGSPKYELCQLFAFSPDNPNREIYNNQEYYPEVVHHEDGYLYGAINEWQPYIYRGSYTEKPTWIDIPESYRNTITTEDVQQIVDSFRILPQTAPGESRLIVNGKPTVSNAYIYNDFAELPLMEVLKGIGADIEPVEGNKTHILVDDKLFILDLNALTLQENDSSENLLTPVPGNKLFSCRLFSEDILLDDVTLKGTLFLMGISVDVRYDAAEKTVTVSNRQ